MIRKATRVGLTAAMVAATLLLPAHSASAADGCGDGWFKQSDGYLTKDAGWQGAGSRTAHIYHTGRVRFCTENDPINNDENRRALIGYPSDTYPFESMVDKTGNFAKFCVEQTIKAHMSGIKSSNSWTISGSFSKGDPEVSSSYDSTTETLTVKIAKTGTCGANANRITARTSNITLTADDESGKVNWVQLTTKLDIEYNSNGTKHVDNFNLVENDYS